VKPINILILAAIALAAPALANRGGGPAARPAQGDDPFAPAQPGGFERRDTEAMDKRVEEKQKLWRAEEARKAKAAKQKRSSSKPAPPQP
jgi:hypothetical protein